MTTLADILAKYPAGSDDRLNALAAWRKAEDERLGVEQASREVKPPIAKRQLTAQSSPHVDLPLAHAPSDKARREWEDRKSAADRQREAEAAAAMRARVTKVAEF
ncbi:MAG TPA: hypothetical protein VGJ20_20725 [Xanthobacteraceae bacterium]